MRAHRNAEAARADTVENGGGAGIGGIFQDDGVAGAHKGFGDEIEGLLAAVGDEQRFVFRGDAVAAKQVEQRFFQRRVAIGGAEIENFLAFAAERGVGAESAIPRRGKIPRRGAP